jgi:hypothetical protein
MNHHNFGVNTKKIFLLMGCLLLLMILGACTDQIKPGQSPFNELFFEGKSDHWHVKMESETDSTRTYIISYIGEGTKPSNFQYEIFESPNTPSPGDGEFKNENEFEIYEACGGACDPLPESFPIYFQWEGKKEKVVIRNKK